MKTTTPRTDILSKTTFLHMECLAKDLELENTKLRTALLAIGTGASEAYDGLTYSEICAIARMALKP